MALSQLEQDKEFMASAIHDSAGQKTSLEAKLITLQVRPGVTVQNHDQNDPPPCQ